MMLPTYMTMRHPTMIKVNSGGKLRDIVLTSRIGQSRKPSHEFYKGLVLSDYIHYDIKPNFSFVNARDE